MVASVYKDCKWFVAYGDLEWSMGRWSTGSNQSIEDPAFHTFVSM